MALVRQAFEIAPDGGHARLRFIGARDMRARAVAAVGVPVGCACDGFRVLNLQFRWRGCLAVLLMASHIAKGQEEIGGHRASHDGLVVVV